MPSRVVPAIVLAVLLAATADAAQIAARRYTIDEGLAHNYVTDIYQDSRGFIWFGTREGLSRFDGERLITYGIADGLPHSTITAVVEDTRGRLWVATRQGGLSRLVDDPAEQVRTGARRQRFKNYSLAAKAGAESVSALLADPDGSLWCLTYGGLFRVRLDGERFSADQIVPVADWAGDMRAYKDRRSRLWFLTDLELLLVDRGRVTRFTAADGIGAVMIVGITESPSGRIFAANRNQLFEFLEAGAGPRWQPVSVALQSGEHFTAVLADSRDQLWIGSDARLRSGPATAPNRIAPVAALDGVETLFEDRARNLWVGTAQHGAWLIPPERMVSYHREDGLPHPYVRRVQETADGRIVVITDRGFAEIAGSIVRPMTAPRGIEATQVESRAVLDRRGFWWVGTRAGLWRIRDSLLQGPGEQVYRTPASAEGWVPKPFEDAAGRIWFAGPEHTVYRIDDPGAATVAPKPVPLGTDLSEVVAWLGRSSSDRLWLGSYRYLARLGDQGAEVFKVSGDVMPRAIFSDSRGWLWVGTRYGGVIVTKNPDAARPAFERYAEAQGLASSTVWAIGEDRWGRMYFGTGRGLDRLDVATGRIRHFGTGDGLAGAMVTECRSDRAGRLWIGTSTGLSLLVPEPAGVEPGSAAAVFTRVRAGGEDLPIAERGTAAVTGIALDPSRPDLLVEFVAPGERSRQSHYEYRLGNGDATWTPVAGDRLVALARLAPGSYRLAVRTTAAEGRAPGRPAEMAFDVLRPIWLRAWFLLSTAGVTAALLFGAHRLRVNRILALERIRRQVALDLHDDIGSGLAQIAVLNEVAKRDAAPAVAGLLDESAGVARRMRESMSDIVWAVDPRRDTLTDLVQRMRQAAFDVLQPQGLRVSFSAPEDRVLAGIALAPDRRKHLLLILKEAITNVARHAGASSVDIVLSLDHKRLRLRVTDDGRGFDASVPTGGTGLHSFRTRAAEIGGTVTIQSSPGAGTTLDVTAPIA